MEEDEPTDKEIIQLAKMGAPKTLAPVQMKQGKMSPRNNGEYSQRTTDIMSTTVGVQHNQEYEDTILKEANFIMQ